MLCIDNLKLWVVDCLCDDRVSPLALAKSLTMIRYFATQLQIAKMGPKTKMVDSILVPVESSNIFW